MHRRLEVVCLVKLVLEPLTIHEHVLFVTLHDAALLEIGNVRLDMAFEVGCGPARYLSPKLRDLLRQRDRQ